MQRRLLSVGTNLTLLKLRHKDFLDAGYEVVVARSGAAAITLREWHDADAQTSNKSKHEQKPQPILQGWKEIAGFLGQPVFVAQRWAGWKCWCGDKDVL